MRSSYGLEIIPLIYILILNPVAKKLLNTLKCPICGGQIDMLEHISNGKYRPNFGCASNIEHFCIHIVMEDPPIRIVTELVTAYSGKYKYDVIQEHSILDDTLASTKILINEVDMEHRIVNPLISKKIEFKKILFDFSKLDRKKLINRIKTILVFQ